MSEANQAMLGALIGVNLGVFFCAAIAIFYAPRITRAICAIERHLGRIADALDLIADSTRVSK
jgi:uncharacterized protein YqgC (DUF456 family)